MSGNPPKRRNTITWDLPAPDPKPARPKRRIKPKCSACQVGDCDRCVAAGCYHRHVVRKVGVLVPVAGLSHDPKGGQ